MDVTHDVMRSATVRAGFAAAAEYFAETVARVPAGGWDRPGLGEWSVRALVGHTSRALLTVESYLDAGADAIAIVDPAAYCLRALEQASVHAAIAERGRQAGAALGEDPSGTVHAIAERVVARVAGTPDTALVTTPVGGMTVLDYLVTRIFELTIHTLDLTVALGIEGSWRPSGNAATITFGLVADLARHRHLDGALLLAATGRRALPVGFTVL